MNETTLRQLMRDVAAETPTHTVVDSYAAAETAQQQRRRRQRLIMAGAAALVVLVTLGSVALALVTDHRPAPPTNPAPSSAVPTVVAPSAFDPARLRLEPGWLPEGFFDDWAVEQDARGARYTATNGSGGTGRVLVFVAPRGAAVPDQDVTNKPARRTPAPGPEINDAETTWIPRETSPGVQTSAGELHFRWATGAQASVDVRDVQNAKDVAVRVAREFRVLVGTPTPLPFTTIRPKVPLTRLDISHGNDSSSMRVMYLAKNGVGPGFEFQLNMGGGPDGDEQIGPWAVHWTQVGDYERHYFFRADADTVVTVVTRPVNSDATLTGPAIELAERAIAEFRMVGDVRDPSSWK